VGTCLGIYGHRATIEEHQHGWDVKRQDLCSKLVLDGRQINDGPIVCLKLDVLVREHVAARASCTRQLQKQGGVEVARE
jgi:hypothetical protein